MYMAILSLLMMVTCIPAVMSEDVYDPDKLYVHMIPHSHDDVGWINTVYEYYFGTPDTYAIGNTISIREIIDTVIEELQKKPDRTYTQVEMKYFTMWYWNQTDDTRQVVKDLVKEGRLEFANGGWTMTDEASPHFEDLINNMMIGH